MARLLAGDPRAVTTLEYALIASMVAVGIAIVATSLDLHPGQVVAAFSRLTGRP